MNFIDMTDGEAQDEFNRTMEEIRYGKLPENSTLDDQLRYLLTRFCGYMDKKEFDRRRKFVEKAIEEERLPSVTFVRVPKHDLNN